MCHRKPNIAYRGQVKPPSDGGTPRDSSADRSRPSTCRSTSKAEALPGCRRLATRRHLLRTTPTGSPSVRRRALPSDEKRYVTSVIGVTAGSACAGSVSYSISPTSVRRHHPGWAKWSNAGRGVGAHGNDRPDHARPGPHTAFAGPTDRSGRRCDSISGGLRVLHLRLAGARTVRASMSPIRPALFRTPDA